MVASTRVNTAPSTCNSWLFDGQGTERLIPQQGAQSRVDAVAPGCCMPFFCSSAGHVLKWLVGLTVTVGLVTSPFLAGFAKAAAQTAHRTKAATVLAILLASCEHQARTSVQRGPPH